MFLTPVRAALVLLSLAIVPVLSRAGEQPAKIDGIWLGTLDLGAQKLRLAFHVKTADGKTTATLDSLDQGAKGIPVSAVEIKDRQVRFEIKDIKGEFNGELAKDGKEIAGKWKQSGLDLTLVLKRVDKLPTLVRPQEPKGPFPYLSEEVLYENKKANVKLAGTLTLPKGEGPFPAVLLITGSGPQDRNEELFGHKPFLLIADYLTRRGFAVLRLDDRGVGGSTGNLNTSTSADLADDVLVGVDWLKSRKEIDSKRIGLIGHSEGGMIAPMAAAKNPEIAFIVLLAGTGLTGEEILLRQNKLLLEAAKADKATIDTQLKWLGLLLPLTKKGVAGPEMEKTIRANLEEWQDKGSAVEKAFAKKMLESLKVALASFDTPWMRYFVTHDPAPTLQKVRCPVLALNGELDLQVPCDANLEAIARALKAGGNKDFTTRAFPKLNHLFQNCKTGSVSEYQTIEETMAPVVLEAMAEWLTQKARK